MARAPVKRLMPLATTGHGSRPTASGSAWVPAASPIRESVYAETNQRPLRRRNRRQSLGPRAGLAAAHGVFANATRRGRAVGDGRVALVLDPDGGGKRQYHHPDHSVLLRGLSGPASDGRSRQTHSPHPRPAHPHHRLPATHGLRRQRRHASDSPTPKPSTTTTSKRAIAMPSLTKMRTASSTRVALGLSDLFRPDGGDHRTFEPLWWRTWRYLDIDITTSQINHLRSNP